MRPMPNRCGCLPNSSANSPNIGAMLTFNGNLKVYVALEPCDMRKSFNTLAALARNHLGLDPLSGAAFLFTNKSRRLIKILYFDGTGYWLVAKRLEKGTYSWPKDIEGDRRKIVLKPTALAMLTDGIDLRDGLQRPWYEIR
jgi:transposase